MASLPAVTLTTSARAPSALTLSGTPEGAQATLRLRGARREATASLEQRLRTGAVSMSACGILTAAAFAASRRHRRAPAAARSLVVSFATSTETPPQARATLTSDPVMPGDFGFDPLGLSNYEGEYIDEVMQNLGIEFDKMRWYREAELMHGRVAMLASLNLLVRETQLGPALPDQMLEQGAVLEFVQMMTVIEAYRAWRLFLNTDEIVGDLGLMGVLQGPSEEELAQRQSRELMSSRIAMVALAGMYAQFQVSGRPIGVDQEQIRSLGDFLVDTGALQEDSLALAMAVPFLIVVLAFDGVRRLSTKDVEAEQNSIAKKSLNIMNLKFGLQDPQVPLPAGVVAGQAPQQHFLSEEQIQEFEKNGVIMIKGGMKAWVEFLQKNTAHQIENPHFWSLVGRMSGLYDYIQRNMWMTNNGFRDFLYYSPLGHIASQLGRTEEVRVSTDMLLVNPNKGFGWHQDNQNGPIDFPDAIRWWVAMDPCGQDGFGAPEYLLGSHKNKTVSDEAVFVKLEDGDLSSYADSTTYVADPGDLILWDARAIHRIVAPKEQRWEEGVNRRALGGTLAKGNTIYFNKGGASGISDLAGHTQQNGELLSGPYFPRIWPNRVPEEEEYRAQGKIVGRSPKKMADLAVTLASNASKYVSFTKVVGKRN